MVCVGCVCVCVHLDELAVPVFFMYVGVAGMAACASSTQPGMEAVYILGGVLGTLGHVLKGMSAVCTVSDGPSRIYYVC